MAAGSLAVATETASAAEAEPEALRLSLKQAITIALDRNPMVVESGLELRRARGAADGVAGVLAENPLFNAEGGARRDLGWSGQQPSVAFRLEQPMDLLGQAGTRRRAAGDLVAMAKARFSLVRAEIAARTHVVYVAAQIAQARVALGQERLAMARQTAEALEMRARLGASSDIDLGVAEAEVGRAEAAFENAQAMASQTLFALREVLELAPQSAATTADGLGTPPLTMPSESQLERLLDHHLAIQAVDRRQLAVDSEIARLERERLPRIALGIGVERPSNQERFFGVSLSVAPALWRRNQGPLAEARVERERTDFERTTTLAGLRRRWLAVRDEQSLRLRELEAVERTLKHEESVRTLVRTGWQAGKFDFLRVLIAERSLADTKQARLDLWADLWLNVIEMNRLLGQEP